MTRSHGVPPQVVAAIAAAVCAAMGVSPDRLRLGISGGAPPDDDRGAWQLLGTLEQMRSRRAPR